MDERQLFKDLRFRFNSWAKCKYLFCWGHQRSKNGVSASPGHKGSALRFERVKRQLISDFLSAPLGLNLNNSFLKSNADASAQFYSLFELDLELRRYSICIAWTKAFPTSRWQANKSILLSAWLCSKARYINLLPS